MGNAYFNSLVARSDHWKSASLRDPAQLVSHNAGGYASGGTTVPLNVTYDFRNDPDPRRQDAAKVVVPAAKNSLPNMVWLPVGTQDGHSYLFTWDAWYGSEFKFSNTGIGNYKTFQFTSPRIAGGRPTIWTEINNQFSGAPTTPGLVRGRYYATAATPAGPGTTLVPSIGPQQAQFPLVAETWTRYWALFDQKKSDPNWTRFSLWVADPTRGPVLIFDRLAITVLGGIATFWLEYNTSTDPVAGKHGPLTGYFRNWVALRDFSALPPMPRP